MYPLMPTQHSQLILLSSLFNALLRLQATLTQKDDRALPTSIQDR